MDDNSVWYVAYGSNILQSRLQKYFARARADDVHGLAEAPENRRFLRVERTLYFAGDSKTWDGPVAFLSLNRVGETPAVAYLLRRGELLELVAGENGVPLAAPEVEIDDVPIDGWRPLAVYPGKDDRRAKYNALLRLPDIEGRPAVTLTTYRDLPLGVPTEQYLDAIRQGTAESMSEGGAGPERSLQEAVDRSRSGRNTGYTGAHAGAPLIISAQATRDIILPLDSVWLPADRRDMVHGAECVTASASANGKAMQVWVFFSDGTNGRTSASAGVYDRLGLDSSPVRLSVPTIERTQRRPGLSGDIPDGDVVQVPPDMAKRLGRWVLAVSPVLAGPLRVQVRDHVPTGSIRLAYAARTLLGLRKEDTVVLQSLDAHSPSKGSGVRRLFRRGAEWFIGAPVVPLRSTEGLVGDDGRHIVRVDSTALDFIGIAPGGQAILSWGHKSARVRVLLQTEATREQMRKQLEESTGFQERPSTGQAESRKLVPEHMRVWVATSVRSKLNIPPDTTVRLRRSIRHLVLGNASTLSLPLAALVVGAAAVPSVHWSVWAGLVLLVVGLTGLPLRLR